MEPNRGKLLSGPLTPTQSETLRPDGSHVVTLDPSLNWNQSAQKLDEYCSTEYHLTATIENSQLGPRDLSLLLEVLNYQIVKFGANLSMVLALTELYLRLTRGSDPSEISDAYIRKTVTVSHILIKRLGGNEFSLYQGQKVFVPDATRELLSESNYLMSRRTYGSRYRLWRPEKLIKIKAVPVSVLIERSSKSKRYSGYCKGYGESHGNAHRKKTKPDWEIDGEDVPDKSERNLILRVTDPNHQISNSLWIKYLNQEKET